MSEGLKGVIWRGRVISAGHPCIVHPPCFPEALHTDLGRRTMEIGVDPGPDQKESTKSTVTTKRDERYESRVKKST